VFSILLTIPGRTTAALTGILSGSSGAFTRLIGLIKLGAFGAFGAWGALSLYMAICKLLQRVVIMLP
jgi:hypothetical protein